MKLTQPLSSGVIVKNGREISVPYSIWGFKRYPMPSECNTWIKLFENLRDNFTDKEIEAINEENWLTSQSNVSDLTKEEVSKVVK